MDWIGKPFGSKVFSNKGRFVYLLAPTPELWTLVLSHRTQILYIADISFVVMAIAPSGHAYRFDFHEQRAASAREDFEKTRLNSLITVGVRDIQGEGFPEEFSGKVASVFLDLPQPSLAIPSVAKMLKRDGIICSFSPCIEQVQRSFREKNLESWENMDDNVGSVSCKRRQRSAEGCNGVGSSVAPSVVRPGSEARGHTGYLTFARLQCVA
ncbi:hypothetical protein Leryth_015954 [Lithospermum erythrorhizon]|nr:hypothetical protein Leryth_015954 [Lithospermum erythrorhizon]